MDWYNSFNLAVVRHDLTGEVRKKRRNRTACAVPLHGRLRESNGTNVKRNDFYINAYKKTRCLSHVQDFSFGNAFRLGLNIQEREQLRIEPVTEPPDDRLLSLDVSNLSSLFDTAPDVAFFVKNTAGRCVAGMPLSEFRNQR